jgi:cvfA/B/C family virulence factor
VARYRIIGWKEIPSLVEAWDAERTVRVPLSQRFQDLIDAAAMRQGASEGEAYLEGWIPGPEAERPGDAQLVADAVAAELESAFGDFVDRYLGAR